MLAVTSPPTKSLDTVHGRGAENYTLGHVAGRRQSNRSGASEMHVDLSLDNNRAAGILPDLLLTYEGKGMRWFSRGAINYSMKTISGKSVQAAWKFCSLDSAPEVDGAERSARLVLKLRWAGGLGELSRLGARKRWLENAGEPGAVLEWPSRRAPDNAVWRSQDAEVRRGRHLCDRRAM